MKPRVTKILKIYNSKFLRGHLKRTKIKTYVKVETNNETNKRQSPHSMDIGTLGGRLNAHRNIYVFSLVHKGCI